MEMNKFTIKHQNEQKLFSSTMPTNLKKIQLARCQSTLCKVSHMKTLIGATDYSLTHPSAETATLGGSTMQSSAENTNQSVPVQNSSDKTFNYRHCKLHEICADTSVTCKWEFCLCVLLL